MRYARRRTRLRRRSRLQAAAHARALVEARKRNPYLREVFSLVGLLVVCAAGAAMAWAGVQ